jgi:hypothetical protein
MRIPEHGENISQVRILDQYWNSMRLVLHPTRFQHAASRLCLPRGRSDFHRDLGHDSSSRPPSSALLLGELARLPQSVIIRIIYLGITSITTNHHHQNATSLILIDAPFSSPAVLGYGTCDLALGSWNNTVIAPALIHPRRYDVLALFRLSWYEWLFLGYFISI